MTNTTGKTPLMDIQLKEVEKQHKKEVEKLNKLENLLTELITKTDNEDLQIIFLEWQGQRNLCNQGFNKFLETIIK